MIWGLTAAGTACILALKARAGPLFGQLGPDWDNALTIDRLPTRPEGVHGTEAAALTPDHPAAAPAPPRSHAERAVYRPDIDGLRSIAVGAVLLFHLFPAALPGGFIGVDIFFVISGFLITSTLVKQERFSIREFYIRRVKRIFPALAVMLAFCLAAGWLLLLPEEFRSLGKHVFSGASFVSNIALFREISYFDIASESKPLLHLWSLGVEEQYYLVWPLFIAALRLRPRALRPAIGVVVALSAVWSVWTTHTNPTAAFYLPFSRFWELGAGGWLACLAGAESASGWSARARQSLSVAGVLSLAAGFAVISQDNAFPGVWAALPVLGSAALVASGPDTTVARLFLRRRAMVLGGLISYPLYLWHWPLLALARTVAGPEIAVATRVGLGLTAIALAGATYRLVELPLRKHPVAGRPLVLAAVVAVLGLAGLGVFLAAGVPQRTPGLASVPTDAPSNCPQALMGTGTLALSLCHVNGTGPAVAALVGDSHAAHLFPALQGTGQFWLLAAHYSCPPVLGIAVKADQADCRAKAERVLRYLEGPEAKSIEVVVVSWYFGYAETRAFAADHVSNHAGPPTIEIEGVKDGPTKARLLEIGLVRYLDALLATGKRVVLLLDVPEFPFQPNRCASGLPARTVVQHLVASDHACGVPLDQTLRRRENYLRMVRRFTALHPTVQVIDPLATLCGALECSVLRDGQVVYRDSHHLGRAGAELIAPQLRALLASRRVLP